MFHQNGNKTKIFNDTSVIRIFSCYLTLTAVRNYVKLGPQKCIPTKNILDYIYIIYSKIPAILIFNTSHKI